MKQVPKVPADIFICHTFGGHKEVINPERNGCLGSWNGGAFELEIAPITGFSVYQADENGKVLCPPSVQRGRRQSFIISIPLFWSEKACLLITKFPSNTVKVQESFKPFKSSNIWEIAIITIETGFFLTIKKVQ